MVVGDGQPGRVLRLAFLLVQPRKPDTLAPDGSKKDLAIQSEVLCNILAHNLCLCIAAWYALGIEPAFAQTNGLDERPAVLPHTQRR